MRPQFVAGLVQIDPACCSLGEIELADAAVHHAERLVRLRPHRRGAAGTVERVAQPRSALEPPRADVPEALQPGRHAQARAVGIVGPLLGEATGDSAQVRQLPVEQVEPRQLVGTSEGELRPLDEADGPLGEALARELTTTGRVELARGRTGGSSRTCRSGGRHRSRRLQRDEVRIGQHLEEVEVRRGRGAAASPTRPSPRRSTRRRRTRRARRTPPGRPTAGAGRSTPARRACCVLLWGRRCDRSRGGRGRGPDDGASRPGGRSGTRRRELDGERDAVEPGAELGDVVELVGTRPSPNPVAAARSRKSRTSGRSPGRRCCRRGRGPSEAHLAGDPQRDAARRHDAHVGAGAHQGGDVAGGVDGICSRLSSTSVRRVRAEVVHERLQVGPRRTVIDTERVADRSPPAVPGRQGRERDERDRTVEALRHLQGEAGLADASGPDQADHPVAAIGDQCQQRIDARPIVDERVEREAAARPGVTGDGLPPARRPGGPGARTPAVPRPRVRGRRRGRSPCGVAVGR